MWGIEKDRGHQRGRKDLLKGEKFEKGKQVPKPGTFPNSIKVSNS